MKPLLSCVTPEGTFQYGIHKPCYTVENLRQERNLTTLGKTTEGEPVENFRNYPEDNITVPDGDWIFEIPNPFFFKGRTFIDKEWADASANNPAKIALAQPEEVSLTASLEQTETELELFEKLPAPLLLALATSSTDPRDLTRLAVMSCEIVMDKDQPTGLVYEKNSRGFLAPVIHNHPLFEAVANNPCLPDPFKIVMVIRPGAQGASEIVGEWPQKKGSHIFEYLRRNSYIPGGHYAANMADDAIRYSIDSLSTADMEGLRHLYYQRTFCRLAEDLQLEKQRPDTVFNEDTLEELRHRILDKLHEGKHSPATLWGWNFGFDFAPSLYRLHASHQQIHQQYAMVPENVDCYCCGTEKTTGQIPTFSCGDLIADCINRYRHQHNRDFFTDYRHAIKTNSRMDDRSDLESSLVVWCDERVVLFVPKAQTSQWELQLMTIPSKENKLAGNIIECDSATRRSLNTGILKAQKALAGLGAKMVTSIEYSKRINQQENMMQPLIYAFLPRLPESPGAFSEAQLRFINGHYPEDFAAVCRKQLM